LARFSRRPHAEGSKTVPKGWMAREVHVKRRGPAVPGPFETERREIDEFVERLVSTAEAFMTVVEFGGRKVSAKSLEVAAFLKGMRFWDRPGCVTLLMETEREYFRHCGPVRREHIVENVEARFEAYYRRLEEGGYQWTLGTWKGCS